MSNETTTERLTMPMTVTQRRIPDVRRLIRRRGWFWLPGAKLEDMPEHRVAVAVFLRTGSMRSAKRAIVRYALAVRFERRRWIYSYTYGMDARFLAEGKCTRPEMCTYGFDDRGVCRVLSPLPRVVSCVPTCTEVSA